MKPERASQQSQCTIGWRSGAGMETLFSILWLPPIPSEQDEMGEAYHISPNSGEEALS
jgi:hypothetical protein